MENNTILKSKPRKRDNETVRREAPSELQEAFLDKCALGSYNKANREVRLWATRPNMGVYQAAMQRSTQGFFPLETKAVGVNPLQ
jgi:hypothetical protein